MRMCPTTSSASAGSASRYTGSRARIASNAVATNSSRRASSTPAIRSADAVASCAVAMAAL